MHSPANAKPANSLPRSPRTGLLPAEILANRRKFGVNELEVKKPESLWKKFLRQFADLLVIVLIIASVLSFFFGETVDAVVILAIVFVNAFIGFFREYKTERMLEALQKLVAPTARVLRSGKEEVISANEVVVGDILILEEGMKVPADAILLEANELKIDEAILTGESIPARKFLESKQQSERKVFSGTTIMSGSGKAICSAVGRESEFGKIAKLATHTQKPESPLTKEMKSIGIFVGKISLGISAVLFAVGYFFQNYSPIESLLFAVAVAVAAVPEGLPVTLTTALALGMQRLVRKRALIRELKSVETLGGTTVICSDKTGTLTRNQMSVSRGWLAETDEFLVSGGGYNPQKGKVEIAKTNPAARLLFSIADFCNEAALVERGKNWNIVGDPTEGALKVAARKFGLPICKTKPTQAFPFESERKRMSIVCDSKVFTKGAPEQLLAICTHYLHGKVIRKLDTKTRKKILNQTNIFANDALRVLGFAYRNLKKREQPTVKTAEQNLIFVGLLGMHDAPRPEVREAVQLCQQAGIRITIVTGDNGLTAAAIGREIGIADEDTPIFTGDQLRKMSPRKLKKILQQKRNLIFARVQPADKLRIVEAYKKIQEVVAVTGDGVNDAPALKRADIGVAMGRTGSDVAKEAADLVLTDDSFASVIAAVAEGRRIYANMRKFILYIFSSNIGELVVIFAAVLIAFPAPLTAVLILMVDLGTDLLPSLALGVDPLEPAVMQQPPRNPKRRIMEKNFILHLLWVGGLIGILVLIGYFWILYKDGWSWGETLIFDSEIHRRGMSFAFATLVIAQLFNSFNFRSETTSVFSPKIRSNPLLWGAVAISVLLAVTVVELPAAQNAFRTASLSLREWGMIVALSASILFFEEMRKLLRRIF
ncbi:MAG: cation-transporting P-type ATPase [Patescibacteria group bacterium]